METFPSSTYTGITCAEMRVIHDLEKVNNSEIQKTDLMRDHEKAWQQVSRCRFVFVYGDINGRNTKYGNLFFTDSHYGQDKIDKIPKNKADLYSLQQKFLDDQKEELIKILYATLDTNFQENFRVHLLEKLSKDWIPQKLPSLQDFFYLKDFRKVLIEKDWRKLLNNWVVETILIEKLKVEAKDRCYSEKV